MDVRLFSKDTKHGDSKWDHWDGNGHFFSYDSTVLNVLNTANFGSHFSPSWLNKSLYSFTICHFYLSS